MPREYRHVQEYETEIFRLRETGHSYREIGEKFGLTKKQIAKFFERYHEKQRKIAAGIAIGKKGRAAKNTVVTEKDKLAVLRYKLDRKDARIKQLEMENELMRDFLLLTGRK